MTADFLSQFIGNPARAKVLRVLISNGGMEMSVSLIARRAGVSPRIVTREAKVLAKLDIAKKVKAPKEKRSVKKKKVEAYWTLNDTFKYVRTLSALVQESSPAQFQNVERALRGSGRLTAIILSGVFMGDPSRPADILIAGDSLNERRLEEAVKGLEPLFGREIRYAAFSTPEFRYRLTIQDRLVRDTLDFPHRVLINKGGLL